VNVATVLTLVGDQATIGKLRDQDRIGGGSDSELAPDSA
jgi:hypothetical protein